MKPAPATLRILLEMRPALEGHAGIPQETRLLFRGLSLLEDVYVEGLLQDSGNVLAAGLPARVGSRFNALSMDQQVNRLSRVVISLEQNLWKSDLKATLQTMAMAGWHLLGGSQQLSRFDAGQFRDYIWRRFFARTLPPEDFDVVTRASFRIARVPWNAMHICALLTRNFGYALYSRLDTGDFDLMIAETPYPATVSPNTHLIVRYHDAIPLLMPHTISDRKYHQASHYRALVKNVQSGAWFVCVSEATRKDLISIFPRAAARSLTIHNMVSHHYYAEDSSADRVPEIIKARLNSSIKPPLDPSFKRRLFEEAAPRPSLPYLLMVSTIEPRKNHLTLLSAWEQLRVEKFPDLRLIIVGGLGWHSKEVVRKFRPWMDRGDAYLLEDVPSAELRLLYRHARATVCPSFGEGFDFSGVEAMKSGGAVVASDIAVHREIYMDAAEFFNPYSVDSLVDALVRVITPAVEGRRRDLVAGGAVVSARYSHDVILPQWHDFLSRNFRNGEGFAP